MFVERAYAAVNKTGEELCGDQVILADTPDSVIAVLSDGLGSGVKANILATITTKIISTMLKGGATLEEVVDTLGRTLPMCQVRNLAYSTFTIVQAFYSGKIYVAEFDNPNTICVRDGQPYDIPRRSRSIGHLQVNEASWTAALGDTLVAMSDGVVHSGIGQTLDFGWLPEKVSRYVSALSRRQASSQEICQRVLHQAQTLQQGRARDDTSVMCLRLREKNTLTAAVGPPKNPGDDSVVARMLWNETQKRIVCGGTTAQIIGREWDKPVEIDMESMMQTLDEDVPPMAAMDSVELVTEGIITLSKTLSYLKAGEIPDRNNGAVRLATELMHADEITFLVGGAINPAHQNPDLPLPLSLKQQVIQELALLLESWGKIVHIQYF